MLKIGHRGAKGYVAENTLASFEKALELGVDGIELDVHLSSDGKAMVIHDETIDRTTSEKGFVNDFTSETLQNLGIPSLEKVFDLVNQKCFLNIEIKDEKATKAVLELIRKFTSKKNWNLNLFQISSFNWNILEFCHTENNQILLGVLTENTIEDALAFAKKINAYSINPNYHLLHSENVTLMQQNGFKIFPWTVNEKSDIDLMKSFCVDGIISDFPDRI